MTEARLTVVVPTRGRAELVEELLASLRSVERDDGVKIDIALYDDSNAAEASRIRESAHRWQARFVEAGPSVRRKRNQGAAEASADIVLYLDSDTKACPGLLAAHLAAYTSKEIGGAAGVTQFVDGSGWLWESVSRSRFLNAFSFARRMDRVPWATCSNVSYRRDLVSALGGFDEDLPANYGGDDADFGMRVNEAGYTIRSVPDGVVTHTAETWLSLPALANRANRWGRADYYLWYERRSDRLRPRLVPQSLRYAAVLLVGAVLLAALHSPALVALWVLGAPAVVLFVSSLSAARSQGCVGDWHYYILDDVLGWLFEISTVSEALKMGSVAPLLQTPIRGPVLPLHTKARWSGQRVAAAAELGVLCILLAAAVASR